MKIGDLQPGIELGPTDWLPIEQSRIDAFAEATEDRQWIHIDPERAAAGPFGVTIAHGYLTLSLVAPFFYELVPLEGGATINYGLNRVRFPAHVPVGSRIRCRLRANEVSEVPNGFELQFTATFEREGGEKPVCVAELVIRHYPE